jgi:hypothetical protein
MNLFNILKATEMLQCNTRFRSGAKEAAAVGQIAAAQPFSTAAEETCFDS